MKWWRNGGVWGLAAAASMSLACLAALPGVVHAEPAGLTRAAQTSGAAQIRGAAGSSEGLADGRGPTADTRGEGQTFETFTPSRMEPLPRELAGVGVDERLNARLPMDLPLVNEAGRTVTLRELIGRRGKPVILQLGYFGCPMLCDQVARSTVESMVDLDLVLGKDFDAIYLSFDPTERPELAREKKATYVKTYAFGKGLDAEQTRAVADGWHFLTGPATSTHEICRVAGFRFQWIESAKQYSHPAVLILVTPDGTISRYLYGARFDPKVLRLSLVDASAGRAGSIMDQIIMMCFHIDPNTGKYSLRAMQIMQMGGALTVLALGAMTGLMVLKGRQMRGVTAGRPKRGLAAVVSEEGSGGSDGKTA